MKKRKMFLVLLYCKAKRKHKKFFREVYEWADISTHKISDTALVMYELDKVPLTRFKEVFRKMDGKFGVRRVIKLNEFPVK